MTDDKEANLKLAGLSVDSGTKYQTWLWKKTGQATVKNLNKHEFDAHFANNIKEALHLVLPMIKPYETFGFGGSDTTRRLGVLPLLINAGMLVYDHWRENLTAQEDLEIRKKQGQCDCYFTSANAVSMTGEIINVDGVGNRTNAMSFGPAKVIVIAGMNKVTPDIPSALKRIREVAAPMRAKSLQMDTPCAKTGICSDCNSPQRICRITAILHRKPLKTDISVIMINEHLGF
ncbi:MAG: lactate utilization protein [Desulfobacteraceae bacterium]|nr:lactate utilization protein [Desulfobacteraceae bacterium]